MFSLDLSIFVIIIGFTELYWVLLIFFYGSADIGSYNRFLPSFYRVLLVFFPRNLPTFVIIIGLTGFYLVFLLDLAIFVALTKLNEFYWVSPCCFPIDLPV